MPFSLLVCPNLVVRECLDQQEDTEADISTNSSGLCVYISPRLNEKQMHSIDISLVPSFRSHGKFSGASNGRYVSSIRSIN